VSDSRILGRPQFQNQTNFVEYSPVVIIL